VDPVEGANVDAAAPPRTRKIDRRKVVFATLIASGYVLALVLGVMLVNAQVRGWDEDAMILGSFAYAFNGTARTLRTFADTNDLAWANESVKWLVIAVKLAQDQFFRNGFPSGAPLNITFFHLLCGITALVTARDWIQVDPSQPLPREYLSRVEPLYRNLAMYLDVVQPRGTDPITQIPPDRIGSIRSTLGEIVVLSDPLYGIGSCPRP
jgi:hypothetical protein